MNDQELRAAQRAFEQDPSFDNEDRYSQLLRRTRGYGLYPPFPTLNDPPAEWAEGVSLWVNEVVRAEDNYYQGRAISIMSYATEGREAYCLLEWSFGSCSSCDFWQGVQDMDNRDQALKDTTEYMTALLRSATVRRWTLKELCRDLDHRLKDQLLANLCHCSTAPTCVVHS